MHRGPLRPPNPTTATHERILHDSTTLRTSDRHPLTPFGMKRFGTPSGVVPKVSDDKTSSGIRGRSDSRPTPGGRTQVGLKGDTCSQSDPWSSPAELSETEPPGWTGSTSVEKFLPFSTLDGLSGPVGSLFTQVDVRRVSVYGCH